MTAPTAFRWLLLAIAAAVLAGCFSGSAEAPPLNAASFQEAYDRLGTMIEQAQAGDADAAEEEYLQAQQITQRISEALEELPAAVIIRSEMLDVALLIRQELAEWRRADFLAAHAERLRGILRDAAVALGIDPPQGD
ncbi:MAG: hypothetical protein IIC26_07905 [Chloroflexi bacterium]|nr:hypothetical protein [Chloroflexota bacterium]